MKAIYPFISTDGIKCQACIELLPGRKVLNTSPEKNAAFSEA